MKLFKFVALAILVFGISRSATAQTGKTKSSTSIQNLISKKREFNAKYGYGFRIQIYYGNEMEARKFRNSFRRNFPKTKSYLKYEQPYWKVLVGNYLEKHLRDVIAMVEKRKAVELLAIGIGHDVTRYYERAVTITDVEQLAGAMTEQLAALFDQDPRARARVMGIKRAS